MPDIITVYPPPLDALLHIGEKNARERDWPDYPATYNLTAAHEAGLIAMACDEQLHGMSGKSNEVWAPLHAWRALGQLRSEAAIESLLALTGSHDEDDFVTEEIPIVLGMIGPACLPGVARIVHDPASAKWQTISLLRAISETGTRHPEARAECISHLVRTIADFDPAEAHRNGFAISGLIDLKAAEEIAVIREAFARDAVDVSIPGDLEDVEIALGLREQRDTPKPNYYAASLARIRAGEIDDEWDHSPPVQRPIRVEKIGRNEPCPCGSGKKYKKCCLGKADA